MTSQQIRRQFLDFFASRNHTIVPSVPIVVKNDPTLLFINAGMNPFKDIFLGNAPVQHPRIADTQKCLRVSGKHNDLEEVGVDTYHHTFFEMLGNWSFGDYFKEEAIEMAWTLLTEVYKLPKDRLYVTIFEGDASEKLAKDTESEAIWKKYIDEDRILLGNKKDNFWEMGDVGPCGPCTEIHFDSRPDAERAKIDGKTLVNQDDPNVIEIWNIVFMEFQRKTDRSLEPLPAKHVDTGMGFERLVRVIQEKNSNYDTDIFMPLIQKLEQLSGKKYQFSDTKEDIAFRVCADHIRAISFTIADGQIPSNNGAGYVIRRILRRAVRYGYSYLGFDQAFIYQLVEVLSAQFSEVFPELLAQQSYVCQVIKEEEQSFLATLSKGIKLFEEISNQSDRIIKGIDAFTLYDTYGFPIDLTRLLAAEKGLEIDETGFEAELQIQKNRSKNATKLETDDWEIISPELDGKATQFIGYNTFTTKSRIVKYRKVTNKQQTFFQIVLDTTPFYAESGGQVGDSGELIAQNGQKIYIFNTVKENDTILHLTKELPEGVELNTAFESSINLLKRTQTAKNHSATHLLQAALRSVLGAHVEQKGSLVNSEVLRFDFSHFAKTTPEELAKIEALVNQKITEAIALKEENNVPLEEAKSRGVMALFGEKYGDTVRVITFDPHFSQELCGGTHVSNTAEIGHFKILSESSIAAGVRRIEAITSGAVIQLWKDKEQYFDQIMNLLKNPKNPIQILNQLQAENSKLRKTLENYEKRLVDTEIRKIVENTSDFYIAENLNGDMAKTLINSMKTTVGEEMARGVLLADAESWKLCIVLGAKRVAEGKNAGNIAKAIAAKLGGGGGGQAQTAMITLPKSTRIENIQAEWTAVL